MPISDTTELQKLRAYKYKGTSTKITNDGDIFVVDINEREIEENGIYLLKQGDKLILKLIQIDLIGNLNILKDSDIYQDQFVSKPDVHALNVEGKSIYKISKI